MINRLSLTLSLMAAGVVAIAQTPTQVPAGSSDGKSVELPGFMREKNKPYQYIPVDPVFWTRIDKNINDNNPIFILQEAAHQTLKYGAQSSEAQEAILAQAVGLQKLGFTQAAFRLYLNIVKERAGTRIGEAALYYLDQLVQRSLVDEKVLEQELVENEYVRVHNDIQSFVAYYKTLFHLKYGFKRWAKPQVEMIHPDSPWRLVMDYWTAVGEITRGRGNKAFEMFTKIHQNPKTPPRFVELTKLQLARMLFEKGEFEGAEKMYRSIEDLGLREHGRILIERAWTAYYLKDYSRALGLIRALKNPLFDSSITPERYVLEMIIYRDLCHFPAVDKAGKAFNQRFKRSLDTIRKRDKLHEERTLFYMATLNRDLQDRATLIDQARKEQERFKRAGLQKFSFYDELFDNYKRIDKTLQAELEPQLEKYARRAAESLLDSQEQIQFLQYTSKLDSLRIIKPEEGRNYKAERISHSNFRKVFWPIDREFWYEELNDYRMLISSRCGILTTPEDLKIERDFR